MATRIQNADLDAWFANTAGGAGNGNGNKMSLGHGAAGGSYDFINRLAMRFPRGTLFDGIASADGIAGFVCAMKTSSGNVGLGGALHLYLERGTTAFTEYQVTGGQGGVPSGANINIYVSSGGPASGEYPGPTRDATNRGEYSGSPAADTVIRVPMLALGKWWYAHPEIASLILVGVAADETLAAQRATFWTRESSSPPYLELTPATGGTNRAPLAPANPVLTYGSDGTSFTLTTLGSDPDGDAITRDEVVFIPND